jgi:hypothetical protein
VLNAAGLGAEVRGYDGLLLSQWELFA